MLYEDVFSARSYADAYVNTFRIDPRRIYSKNFQRLLESVSSGDQLLEEINPTATSNGSIMGVSVIGLLPTIKQVKLAASIQAVTTHNIQTVPFAQSIAMMAHYYHYQNRYDMSLHDFLCEYDAFPLDKLSCEEDRLLPVNMSAHNTWEAVWLLQEHTSMHKMLRAIVSRGGDTDSVAAIALGIASLNRNVVNDLPRSLYDNSPDFEYGLKYLERIDTELMNGFPKES
jgi:ADP-ribosyl-[dinitrogen reductase] hydrolase